MNLYDDENMIIEDFQYVKDCEVWFPNFSEECELIYNSIHDKTNWKEWICSAAKDAPPPGFYNTNSQIMMDVMRVDDHAFKNKKGKVINPTNARESLLRKELEESGILNLYPNAKVYINPHTGLETKKDHNYIYYKKNFARVISEHLKKVDLYKKNHPGYKTIFFVMDESSAYLQLKETDIVIEKCGVKANPHLHFVDKFFLDVIKATRIDYLVWYTPYKLLYKNKEIFKIPKVIFFDINKLDIDEKIYKDDYMISNEL